MATNTRKLASLLGASGAGIANDGTLTSTSLGAIAGTDGLTIDGATILNEGSADVDFRVESNGNANMLFVDGGNDRVGVGTAAPTKILDIHDTKANVPTLRFTVTDTATDSAVNDVFGEIGFISLDSDNPGQAYIKAKHLRSGTGHGATDMGLAFGISGPNSSTTYQTPYDAMVIDNSGNVGIGTTAPSTLLHLYSATAHAEVRINCGNSSESTLRMGRIEDATEAYINYNGSDLGITAKNTSGRQVVLTQAGYLGIGTSSPYSNCEVSDDTNTIDLSVSNQHTSYTSVNLYLRTYRAGSSESFDFIRCVSDYDSSPEVEFRIRNNGASYNDAGTWSNPAADFAEFFEWKDGNPSDEDRAGITVVLDGDKIRKAEEGETPIGVVSKVPTIVGDAAWGRWDQKYLKDDFGRYLLKDYTATEWIDADEKEHHYRTDRIPADVTVPADAVVLTEDDNGNKLEERSLNPDFDDSQEYVQRKERKEWEAIGILGKLRILKDQPVADSWIKMKDVSETVELWLVK